MLLRHSQCCQRLRYASQIVANIFHPISGRHCALTPCQGTSVVPLLYSNSGTSFCFLCTAIHSITLCFIKISAQILLKKHFSSTENPLEEPYADDLNHLTIKSSITIFGCFKLEFYRSFRSPHFRTKCWNPSICIARPSVATQEGDLPFSQYGSPCSR